jgi:murein DD-endopeptidase MepM/ murein hydrolase activator NlpD
MDGKVAYANTTAEASSYGRYIVLEHEYFLTLYAHLASIDVTIGQIVKAGEKIGILGMSSNCYEISNGRAHLHFEIDFQIADADTFGKWYANNFKDKNVHGACNGINLIGIDPLATIEKLIKGTTPTDLLIDEKEAMTIQIVSKQIPWFVRQYQPLVAKNIDLNRSVEGWTVEFTWFGLPKKWTPIYIIAPKTPPLKLISYRKSLKENAIKREVLKEETTGITVGSRVINVLKKMGFDVK